MCKPKSTGCGSLIKKQTIGENSQILTVSNKNNVYFKKFYW
jgi:hypothetical protein